MAELFDNGINAGADFSTCRKYRYRLWRNWDTTKPLVMFIGLNPSTANETEPDNTIKSVTRISKNLGFGGFYMMNCFPLVSRHPDRLWEFITTSEHAEQEIKNYNQLKETGTLCQQVIFAWGSFKEVTPAIVEKLVIMFPGAMALKINANGSPQHPLYISSKVQPVKFEVKKNTGLALKAFLQNNFHFSALKKSGVFPKEMKHTDYEGQEKIICRWLGLSSIYEYGKHEISCHISYAGQRPLHLDKDGKLKTEPFVTTIFPNQLHI